MLPVLSAVAALLQAATTNAKALNNAHFGAVILSLSTVMFGATASPQRLIPVLADYASFVLDLTESPMFQVPWTGAPSLKAAQANQNSF